MFSTGKGVSGTLATNPGPLPGRLFSDFARLRPLLADSSGTVNSRRPGPRPGPRPCEATFGCPPPAKSSVHTSLVEPHLLHAAPAVYGLVRNQVLHIRPDRVVVQPPPQPGADRSLLELSLDYLNQREALGWVQLLRLVIDQSRDLLVAVAGIVARRPAAVVLVKVGVRVVRLDTGPLYPDLKVAARLQRMPLGRLHLPDGRLNADVLQLIDREGGHIQEVGERARQDPEPKWSVRPQPSLGQEGPRPRLLVGRFAIAGERTDVLVEEPPHSIGR